jgi:hypothetical protein
MQVDLFAVLSGLSCRETPAILDPNVPQAGAVA